MLRALRTARCDPDEVGYVNAHATSTPQGRLPACLLSANGPYCHDIILCIESFVLPGDEIEAGAIQAVFGKRGSLLVSSTKGATGHLLGGAGSVEAALAVLALHTSLAPPTVNLERPEPDGLLPGLVGPGAPPIISSDARAVLSNSFGFGGTNAALVFVRPPAPSEESRI